MGGGFIVKRKVHPMGGHDGFFFEKNCRMEGGTPLTMGNPALLREPSLSWYPLFLKQI